MNDLSPIYDPRRHHRRSYRHPTHDYARAGWYFITICLNEPRNGFARVNRTACDHSAPRGCGYCRGQPCLILTEIGRIASQYWREIPLHAPNASVDAYVIMPDHFHGIVRLSNDGPVIGAKPGLADQSCDRDNPCRQGDARMSAISPKAGSLPVIVRSFKGAVKTWAQKNGIRQFSWQGRFYDRAIRDAGELYRIRHYIVNNPGRLLDKTEPVLVPNLNTTP